MSDKVHDYHDGNRYYQDLFDTRRLADYVSESRVQDEIDDVAKEIIERADMFFLATCDHRGLPTCSYKGGDPGFIKVVDAHTQLPAMAFSDNGTTFKGEKNVREVGC